MVISMEYNVKIQEMVNYKDKEVEGYYILKEAAVKVTSSGKNYLNAKLMDRTGMMDLKMWDYNNETVTVDDIGKVVKVRGSVDDYKGNLQLVVKQIRLAISTDPYNLAELVPMAPIDKEAELSSVRSMIAGLEDDDYRRICQQMLQKHLDSFSKIPAAKSVHHSFLSGLLMHTSHMLKIAAFLADLYSDLIDRDLLLAGTLLHDFAKDKEFTFSELGMVADYSVKGQLLGHLVMGASEIAETAKELGIPEEKSLLLQHLILSHHGEPEFGAAVRPACAEAELLSLIDLIDSRMEIYSETLENLPIGQFSQKVFSLDKKIFRHS
jgi:3'-5' exoribonuclease